MQTKTEGIVTIKNEKGELVGVIYKDGPTPSVIYLTSIAGVEDIVELMGCSLMNNLIKTNG